jgi:hypothetical protein
MEAYMELSKKTTILFTPELHARLSELASRLGISLGELVREACERQYGLGSPESRVGAVQKLSGLALPVAGTKKMKRESVPEESELMP